MNNVTFTKITSTPTSHAWSQTYSAGNFSALIALQTASKTKDDLDKEALQNIGHDIVSTLEAEYFTLEKKDLESIKQAVVIASEKIPEHIQANLIITTIVDTTFYGFLFGGGKILMKRGKDTGILLEKKTLAVPEPVSSHTVSSTSGYVKHDDMVIIASDAFLQIFPDEKLLQQLSDISPEDAAETITPQLQKKKEGAACAIIISYKNTEQSDISTFTPISQPTTPPALTDSQSATTIPVPTEEAPVTSPEESAQATSFSSHIFPKKKILLLAVAVIIVLVITGSIIMKLNKKHQDQEHAKFQATYTTAQSKYDEGQNLMALNKQEAHDDFVAVQSLLTPYKGKLPADSSDNKQLTDLLTKDEAALAQVINGVASSAKQATDADSPVLAAEVKQNALYATQDTKSIYLADANGVMSVDPSTGTTTTTTIIITNKNDWSDVGGLGTYLGNIYVLDKKSTILKYVPASSGFAKTNYLKDTVNLSSATGLAIDGSIYVLSYDGSIQKFTKGIKDTFSVSGLEKPLKNPTRIFTTVDDANVYVLDNGNGRVVVLNKTGAYQNQYTADVLAQAKDFDVHETDKKIFALSQGKIWEVDMK